MTRDMVEDVIVNPSLHVSTTRSIFIAQTIVGRSLENLKGSPFYL